MSGRWGQQYPTAPHVCEPKPGPSHLARARHCPLCFRHTLSAALNQLGKGVRRRHARWPWHTRDPRPGPSPQVSARGTVSAEGEPLPQAVVWVRLGTLQTGSYFQHQVVLRGGGSHHLPQHPLALQGDSIYGGQHGRHDLWELEGEQARAREAWGGQTLDSRPGHGRREVSPRPAPTV